MRKEAEYIEGPEALERFKQMMTKVFRAPKGTTPFAKPKPKRKRGTASKD